MERRATRSFVLQGIIVLSLATSFRCAAAQEVPPRSLPGVSRPPVYDDVPAFASQDLQTLRKDLRSEKKQIVAANMDLTDSEAEKFWPVYDRYAADLGKIYQDKVALVLEYFDNYKSMSGDEAESYIRRRAAVEQDVMALRLKYVPEFRKVLSGRQAALFFQIDWRLDLLIDLQFAQMPLIDP